MPDTPYSRNDTSVSPDRGFRRDRSTESDRVAALASEMSRLQRELQRLREALERN